MLLMSRPNIFTFVTTSTLTFKKSHLIGLEVIRWAVNLCYGQGKRSAGAITNLRRPNGMVLQRIGLFGTLTLRLGTVMSKNLLAFRAIETAWRTCLTARSFRLSK